MSPKVFELSPPKNESNLTAHHPLQMNGELTDELLFQKNLKRCRDFCSDDELTSGPDVKRLHRADSSDSIASSLEPMSVPDFKSVDEKDGVASDNGKNIPPKRPKKVKKKAGQRKVCKRMPKSSSGLGTITFQCSMEVMQKLEELYNQVCPPSPTREDDSVEAEGKKEKEKKARFSRCPSEKKYLCEVCSRPDCMKCNNCL